MTSKTSFNSLLLKASPLTYKDIKEATKKQKKTDTQQILKVPVNQKSQNHSLTFKSERRSKGQNFQDQVQNMQDDKILQSYKKNSLFRTKFMTLLKNLQKRTQKYKQQSQVLVDCQLNNHKQLSTLRKTSSNQWKQDIRLYERYSNIIVANLVK